jgi:hypothetical protein
MGGSEDWEIGKSVDWEIGRSVDQERTEKKSVCVSWAGDW